MDAGDVIHPVSKQDSEGVRARSKPPRHIESVVEDRLPVVGPAGMDHGFGDAAPVQVKFVLSQTGDDNDCALHRSGDAKLFAEDGQRRCRVGPLALIFSRLWLKRAVWFGGDPACLPFGRMQDCHRPLCWSAPGGGLSRLIPDSHFPVVATVRREWLATIRDVETLAGSHSARIPQVSAILRKLIRRRGNQNQVAALCQVVRARRCSSQFPAKAWGLAINTDRINCGIGSEFLRGNATRSCPQTARIRVEDRLGGSQGGHI